MTKNPSMSDNAVRKRARRKMFQQLSLYGQLACESHSNESHARVQRILEKMMRLILDLHQDNNKMTDERRMAFTKIMEACALPGPVTVEVDPEDAGTNLVSIEGIFDLTELCKRVVWSGYGLEDKLIQQINEYDSHREKGA